MADPSPYEVEYSFAGFQATNPTSPLPASALDGELANIATAVEALVSAMLDVRRSDGALKNEIVTYESLSPSLQLTFDPTNGDAVAAAIATTEANAALTDADRIASAASAAAAVISAAAAAASASSVNLTLYLAKANNLAGLGNIVTARANIEAPKVDGSDITGRLARLAAVAVTDWNTVVETGWASGNAASNGPDASSYWLVQTMAVDAFYVTQIAYNYQAASTSLQAVTPMRRHSYNNGGTIAWTSWESMAPAQVGSTIYVNGTSAPPGYVKENGALLTRASYPALYAYAVASGNIVSEATWSGGSSGAFSTGDLSTTFRIPDSRGEFIRGYDDSRGVDVSRVIGARQAQDIQPHLHSYNVNTTAAGPSGSGGNSQVTGTSSISTGSTGTTETRPRNIAKLACIKY